MRDAAAKEKRQRLGKGGELDGEEDDDGEGGDGAAAAADSDDDIEEVRKRVRVGGEV